MFARLLFFRAGGAAVRVNERGAGRYRPLALLPVIDSYDRGAIGCERGGSAREPDRGGQQGTTWVCRGGVRRGSSFRGAATVLWVRTDLTLSRL